MAEPVATPSRGPRRWRRFIWIAAAGLAVLALAGTDRLPFAADANQLPVVPVRVIAGDPMTEILAPRNGDCISQTMALRMAPDLVRIQLLLLLNPFFRGWTDTTPPVYVGSLDDFAVELGATEVVVGQGEIWAALGARSAKQVIRYRLPLGRLVWSVGGAASRCGE